MNITNDKVTEYIYSLYTPLTDELAELRTQGEKGHIPIILRDSETLLVSLIESSKPERILELGTAIGYSAAVFGTAAKQAGLATQVITVEADPLYAGDARENLKGYDNVQLIEGDACQVMDEMISSGKVMDEINVNESVSETKDNESDGKSSCFDMIFIDAAKSHYREFWDRAVQLTHKGSLIICDNILMQAKTADSSYDERGRFETNIKYMRAFLEYVSGYEGAVSSILPVGDGMSISVIR